MDNNKELDGILRLLADGALSEAMERLASFCGAHPEPGVLARLKDIRDDYDLMFDYWSKGYKDEQLERVYKGMTSRVYRLTADTYVRYIMSHSTYLTAICRRVKDSGREWSLPSVRNEMENFVSEMALSELEPEAVGEQKKALLCKRHQQEMNDLFDYLWTSDQWTDSFSDTLERILLSPTIDINDRQLIVSAVMLGAMNMFDIRKFTLLANVYRRSTDEHVRQRALVGWVLAIGRDRHQIFPEERETLLALLADETVREELIELQIQMLYCLDAEKDNRTIQKDIMPDLMRHNGLNITPNGIEEKDDTSEDILNTEASERNMERVEEGFRKMMDMQKAGSDIYFGGFSQMKRFPFFDSVSNWFVPFTTNHPAISSIYSAMGDSKLIRNVVGNVPFCDSDKYSFVMAFQQVVGRLPQNVREMLGNGGTMGLEPVSKEERNTPAYIRRIYLQNLYRFFRLFPSRALLYNPFEQNGGEGGYNYVFVANGIFRGTVLSSGFGEIASCLTKRGMLGETVAVLDNYDEHSRDYLYYMMCGNMLLRHPSMAFRGPFTSVSALFSAAMEQRSGDVKAMSGYARALFYEGRYADARDVYGELLEKYPDNKNFMLNRSVCLVNLDHYDEALAVLYKLNYDRPDDDRVNRVMARALMCTGKYDKADRIYSALCGSADGGEEDVVNFGFCKWLAGNKAGAAGLFAEYLRQRYSEESSVEYRNLFMTDIFEKEKSLLSAQGMPEVEARLMSDLVYMEILRVR